MTALQFLLKSAPDHQVPGQPARPRFGEGTRDGSARVARRYLSDPRVSYTANDRDLGYYGSLNRALHETACPLFVPFAADDLMAAENLEQSSVDQSLIHL